MSKLEPVKLFSTPKDHDQIMTMIESMPQKCQSQAIMIAMFTWNLACKLANDDQEKSEETGP